MFPLLVIWPQRSGDFLKQESNRGFITGHSESSAKKTELCMYAAREGRGDRFLSPDEITIKKEIGKSAMLGANGSVVGQVWWR